MTWKRTATFLCADSSPENGDVVLMGVPFDGTSCFRPGSRFGPHSIRIWSDVLESFSPELDMDLEEIRLGDLGDLEVPVAGWDEVALRIRESMAPLLAEGKIPVVLGGEHLISLAAVGACLDRYPNLCVLHVDAHLDLRDEYESDRHTHATVMRRVMDLLGSDRVFQWGVRSGTREEWKMARSVGTIIDTPSEIRDRLGGRPLYLSLDLDVLDPSILPETGAPEPGGLFFRELLNFLHALRGLPIVGADVVEYSPAGPGMGGPSGAVAAKVVREVILLCEAGRT
ncbi:MAG: agmatinase [bacterium]|nr:MAG: agmatinase [bacterium]